MSFNCVDVEITLIVYNLGIWAPPIPTFIFTPWRWFKLLVLRTAGDVGPYI